MRGVKLSDLFSLLRDAALAFGQDRAPRLAAALAYYTMFSIAPLLFLIVAVAGYFLGAGEVRGELFGTFNAAGEVVSSGALTQALGGGTAKFLNDLAEGANLRQSGLIATVIGVATLFLGATGLFAQLQDALNTLWGADPPPAMGFVAIVRTRVIAFALVLLFGALILAFLVGNTVLSAYAQKLGDAIGAGAFFARLGTLLLSTGLFTLVFATVYKFLPDVKLTWRDVWVGAGVTAFLFSLGQLLIGFYFGRFSPGSVFGAAGSLVVLLLWIYYSAQILFFGAEITWTFAQKFGSRAGGAFSPAKKEALAQKGADIDPTPSAKEREAAENTPGVELRPANGGANFEQREREPLAPLPSPLGLLWRAILAVLALPALPVVLLLRRLQKR